jgi:hypothetical protein
MFASYSYLCSQSTSYLINYEIQSHVFNALNEKKIKWLRIPCLSAWCALSIISTVTRTAGVAEVFFKGLAILFTAPLAKEPISSAKKGLNEVFSHTGKNILRAAFTPFGFIGGALTLIAEPKKFILEMNECMKINVIHAKKNTIGSIEHYKDLATVDGIAKEKFLDYQNFLA